MKLTVGYCRFLILSVKQQPVHALALLAEAAWSRTRAAQALQEAAAGPAAGVARGRAAMSGVSVVRLTTMTRGRLVLWTIRNGRLQ